MQLFFYPIADSYLLVGAIALILAVILVAVGPGRGAASTTRRLVLGVVRVMAIALVLLALLRPTLVYTETTKEKATVVVLADASRSMGVSDGVSGKGRWESLRQTLEDAAPALRELTREFELKAYTFDAELHVAQVQGGTIVLPETPGGQQTAVGAAMEDAANQEAGKRVLGIVVLTDGRQQARPPRDIAPQSVAGRLRHQGNPVFTVVFGEARGLGGGQDLAVKDLLVNDRVFVKNELSITGQIRVDGYVNREVPVRVLFETAPGRMEVVAQEKIKATADGQLVPVKFTYIPQTPGEYKLTLQAIPQAGEQVTTNNELNTFVTVLKGGLRVLYIEGALRPEQKFLRRALDASQDIKVDYVRFDPRLPETRPSRLEDRFQPGKYDVYIIGDVDATAFRNEKGDDALKALAAAVDRGAGLIMLGGMQSFGAGGYWSSPLADVLPVAMDRLERQRPGDAPRPDIHLPGPLRMLPTPFGLRHFALTLSSDPRENTQLWAEKLPPLDGANRFLETRAGAVVLADTGGDQGKPLLVSQDYGRGRVLAFAGDSTWRWWMRGFETAHKRFWRQVVLWLAHKEQAGEGNVWVKIENRQILQGDRVEFSAGAAEKGEPIKDAEYQVEIQVPPEPTAVPGLLVRQGEQMVGSFRGTQTPGDYVVVVKATREGKELGEARARFSVAERDLELDNATADPDTMENVAKMTGGKATAPEQLPELIRQLTRQTQHLEIRQETKSTFWDTWPFFLALVGLLSLEWYLRKRWGLV